MHTDPLSEYQFNDKIENKIVSKYIDKAELDNNKCIGSYKLSRYIVDRLLSATIDVTTFSNGKKVITNMPNVTDCELRLLLYFTQICNCKGQISFVNYLEIVEATGISVKSYYNAMKGLVKKQYIKQTKSSNGYYQITLYHNDFTSSKSYKRGYINTNNNMFIPGTPLYQQFSELGLNAKKTLLYILINYNTKRGYKFATKTLARQLGVQPHRIHRYLKACTSICGSFYNRRITMHGVVVCIQPNKYSLLANKSIYDTQWTSQKRLFYKFLTHNKIDILLFGNKQSKTMLLHSYLNKLYNLLYTYGKKIGRYKTLQIIYKTLYYYKSLDIGKLKVINSILSNNVSQSMNNKTCNA